MRRACVADHDTHSPAPLAQGLRPFAAEAHEVVLPPQFSVPGRYAAALYMAASKAGDLDSVTKELSQMAGLLQQSDDFRQFVTDPTVGQNVKIEGLSGVMDGLGATETTKNFFGAGVVEGSRNGGCIHVVCHLCIGKASNTADGWPHPPYPSSQQCCWPRTTA